MVFLAADFLVEFPEFADAPTALIDAKLQAATYHVSQAIWGARYQQGVFVKAAHLLSMSPSGEKMRIAKGSKETLYSAMFDELLACLPARTLVT
jgi:hypothetical protein